MNDTLNIGKPRYKYDIDFDYNYDFNTPPPEGNFPLDDISFDDLLEEKDPYQKLYQYIQNYISTQPGGFVDKQIKIIIHYDAANNEHKLKYMIPPPLSTQ